jgi:hypothetical protein
MRSLHPVRWILLLLVALTLTVSVRADVIRVVIDGTINPVSAEYI